MKHSERQLVERIRRRAGKLRSRQSRELVLRQGIGDDCAILSCFGSEDLLVTTDLLLEGVHFLREWQPPDSIGYKTLARGLSDIAAMGGIPRYCFLSLALPRRIPDLWVGRFFAGLFRLAEQSGVILAGGDTAASHSGVMADIMVIGVAPSARAVRRSGARAGDEVWVSGRLGGAAAALDSLRKGKKTARRSRALRPLFYPEPRLKIGEWLSRRGRVSAMMDLSDGLSIDLARLCKASGVGAVINADAIPRYPGATPHQALHGGEDFELLFTVPPGRSRNVPQQVGDVRLTRIGTITSRRQLRLVRRGNETSLPVRGFEHF